MAVREDFEGRRESGRSAGEADQGGQSGGGAGGEQLTGPILVVALVSSSSGLLYGHDTGIISGALLLGAVIGALVCSRLSARRGRHVTMVIIASVSIVGALAAAASPNPPLLALSRVVLGFAVGGATQTAPMFVAETAPSALRGRLVLCFQIGAGIVIAPWRRPAGRWTGGSRSARRRCSPWPCCC